MATLTTNDIYVENGATALGTTGNDRFIITEDTGDATIEAENQGTDTLYFNFKTYSYGLRTEANTKDLIFYYYYPENNAASYHTIRVKDYFTSTKHTAVKSSLKNVYVEGKNSSVNGAILDNLGEEIPDKNITTAIKELGNKLWWNETKDKIGLSKYYIVEHSVAEELIRIRNAKSDIYCDNWRDRIEHLERNQGWKFTEEQMCGIETVLNNNITVIHGLAGSGKTSVVSGVLEALHQYSSVMCALSGRAASRMSEITGKEGFTIHRLLGYPKGDPKYQKFAFNQDDKLKYSIYILDEISMVDAKLFYYLLRAIPDGAKLICLGDSGQLESIGCGNIAYDMIYSAEIPTIELTKIHRQAARSAIITQSIAIRNGIQIIDKDWTGTEVRGDLKDLKLVCYSDSSNTFYNIMETFSRLSNQPDFNIMDCQIIVPVKTKGDACTYKINNTIQELYNPSAKNKKEITRLTTDKPYVLREGDKIINVVNNYNLSTPIYNGNIGTIKSIGYSEELDSRIMTIDFMGMDAPNSIYCFFVTCILSY